MFLHALAYVTDKKPDEFNAVLRELLERYPDIDITPIASAWLKGMAQGRKLQEGSGGNMRGMIWDMRLGNDSTAVADGEAAFEIKPDDKLLLVMTFATDQVSTNELLYELARHNFKSFVVKDFDLEPINYGLLGMIVIHDFDSMNELEHYRKVMVNSTDFKLPAGVRPVVISEPNFSILISEGRSFDDYFRFLQEQNAAEAESWAGPPPVPPVQDTPSVDNPQDAVTEEPAADTEEPLSQPVSPAPKPEPAPADTIKAPVVVPAPVTTVPAAKPDSVPQPATKPAPAPKQAPVIVPIPTKPDMPVYDPGSEGDDDPLLE